MNKIEIIERALYDFLPYRLDLRIDRPFGLEIEAGLLNAEDRYYICDDNFIKKGYKMGTDSSVGGDYPLEIETPLLFANRELWLILKDLSDRMKECEIDFSHSAFQVNVDVLYGFEDYYNLLLFFRKYEHILLRFSKSFFSSLRDMSRANSIRSYFKASQGRIVDERNFNSLVYNKYYDLSFKYKDATPAGAPPNIVEFRSPNGCDEAWVWQNYINTFYHLVEYILSCDGTEVKSNYCKDNILELPYNGLWLYDAISFVDKIFDEDIDKIYFLKQYIGKDTKEASEFIKRRA